MLLCMDGFIFLKLKNPRLGGAGGLEALRIGKTHSQVLPDSNRLVADW